jgi:hypothetical protein
MKNRRVGWGFAMLVCLIGGLCSQAATTDVHAEQSGDLFRLDNGRVQVELNASLGTFRATFQGVAFLTKARVGEGGEVKAEIRNVNGSLGAGRAIVLTRNDRTLGQISLFPDVPFILLSHSLDAGDEPLLVDTLTPIHLELAGATPLKDLRVLGCDGLASADQNRASYAFLAAADPNTRVGVVAGWLTDERASGIVTSQAVDGAMVIEGREDYGKLRLKPNESAEGELFAIGRFEDALLGLEAYADTAAKVNNVKLPPIPSGYCTWYSKPHGGAADEKSLARLATFVHDKLERFGFNLIQIDDKWQIRSRDFTAHKSNGPYPGGMKSTADELKRLGLTGGLWFIPFGWDPQSPTFDGHQDYFVHHADGSLYEVKWAGTCLDMTHPGARELLGSTVARITHEWGYKYLKIDGLWTGMATQILYPNPSVRDDKIGDAVFHDPTATNLQAYRQGLRLVRQAAGNDVFIDGCNVAQNMRTLAGSYGLVDAMRVGRDIGASWDKILPSMTMATRLYFYHGRVWHNDPDCLMLREPLTLAQARAWGSWIAVSGQLNLVSEWLPDLPEDRLEIVKRSMPNTGLCGRPLDLFEQADARIWHLVSGKGETRRDIIALFNWDAKNAAKFDESLQKLDLPGGGKGAYVGFDYWRNAFVGPISGSLKSELPAASCQVLALRPVADHPQVVSTSRHITQGLIDLRDEHWDAGARVLSGESKVVGEDAYQIRVVAPDNSRATLVELADEDKAAGASITIDDAGPHARITLRSPLNREVHWRIHF